MIEIEELKQNITGEVLVSGDTGYKEAATTYVLEGSPAVVVQPRSAADVVAAIAYAKAHSLVLSVKSGGHSGAGLSTNDGGMVIDMSALRDVTVYDEAKHLVRIGSGAHWGDVALTLRNHGLVLSAGDTKSVGVGGLTLGGGIGIMVRKYGLALDSLVGAEIVTADGHILHVSADEHTDLFWAIRGGGGNFGVVTYFEFEAHPLGDVFYGHVVIKLEDLRALLTGWRDGMRVAPEEVTTTLIIMPPFGDGPRTAQLLYCYAGDDEPAAMQALEPLLTIGSVQSNDVRKMPYAEALEEAHAPVGMKAVVKDALVEELNDELISELTELFQDATGRMFFLRSLGGAVARVPADATAFAYRNAEALLVAAAFMPADAPEADAEKAIGFWKSIAVHAPHAYANFLSAYKDSDVAAVYPSETHKRLALAKATYDPRNIFDQNCNIKPENA